MGPGVKVDPLAMLGEAKRICDTLVSRVILIVQSTSSLFLKVGISLSINYTPSASTILCIWLPSSHSATATTATTISTPTWAIYILYKLQIPRHYRASNFGSTIICCFSRPSASIPIRRSSIPHCTVLWLWRIRGLLSFCTPSWAKPSTCNRLCEWKHRRCCRKRWKSGRLVRRRNGKAKEACRGAPQR